MGETPLLAGPAPPSSAYCLQRSASIVSNAWRNRRIAMSPLFRRPLLTSCPANADAFLPNSPTPIVAAPAAATPLFKNDRRLEGAPADTCESFFFICFSLSLSVNTSSQHRRGG